MTAVSRRLSRERSPWAKRRAWSAWKVG